MTDPISVALNGIRSLLGDVVNKAQYEILDPKGTQALVKGLYRQGSVIVGLNDDVNKLLYAYGQLETQNQDLVDSVTAYTDQLNILDKRNKSINETFGVGTKAAAQLSMTYQKLANTLGVFNGEQAITYGNSIRKMLPMYKQQGKENDKQMQNLMAIQHVLTTNMGLTEEDAANFSMYASKAGENAASNLEVAKQAAALAGDENGSLGYMKMIVEGISGLGADMQLQYGRLGGNLEIATLKANKLGVELQDLADTGTSLLNIESSIGEELEYQLLTGRRLVDQQSGESLTNMFRQATLMGDMSKQADTLNTILEQEGATLENNLFARQQMSKLLGMDELSLSRALQKKKLLESEPNLQILMNLNGSELQAQAEAMYKNGQITEAKLEEIAKVSDTRTQDEILKAQLKLDQEQVETMKDMLTTQQAELALRLEEAYKKARTATKGAMYTDKMDFVGRLGAEIGMDLKSYGVEFDKKLLKTNAQKAQDVLIPPGSSAPIVSAPAGTFVLDPQDTILAGTDSSLSNANNLIAKQQMSKILGTDESSNLSAVMLQVGRMIVAAINSNGNNVFGSTSMNSSYYS